MERKKDRSPSITPMERRNASMTGPSHRPRRNTNIDIHTGRTRKLDERHLGRHQQGAMGGFLTALDRRAGGVGSAPRGDQCLGTNGFSCPGPVSGPTVGVAGPPPEHWYERPVCDPTTPATGAAAPLLWSISVPQ